MKFSPLLLFSSLFLFAFDLRADWQDGQAAVGVLGQEDFRSGDENRDGGTDPTALSLRRPEGVAVDPSTGKVFVADQFNNRVLRYASAEAMGTGLPAEAVFGQPDFTSRSPGTTETSMAFPRKLTIDSAGNLWVADSTNDRILLFDNAATRPFTEGVAIPADGVIGQPDLTTGTAATTASGLDGPTDVTAGSSGRLWVVDFSNNRVLRYDNAATRARNVLTTGVAVDADGVLGQPGFVNGSQNRGNPQPSANTMDSPMAAAVGPDGELWVTDLLNNRVLRFDDAANKADGDDADGVLGQSDFTSTGTGLGPGRTWGARGVDIDSTGTLWIVTEQANRIGRWDNAATKENGADGDGVLGQNDLSTNGQNWDASDDSHGSTPTATGFGFPSAVATGPDGKLWVADTTNNRVTYFLRDDADESRPELEWDPISGATWYRLWINRNDSVWETLWIEGNGTTTWMPSGDLPAGRYTWWVAGWNEDDKLGPWSEPMTFSVGVPEGVAPVGPQTPGTVRPPFTWTESTGSTWYQLYLNRNGSLHESLWLEQETTAWTPASDLPAGDYDWWVRGWNPTDESTPWSESVSFSIGIPEGIAPVGTLATGTGRPEFTWTESPGSTWYQVYLNRDGSFHESFWLEQETTAWTPASDLPSGDYDWWVRGWNPTDKSTPWSEPTSFAIPPVMLQSPEGQVFGNPRPVFSWTVEPGATFYHLWINLGDDVWLAEWLEQETTTWIPSEDLPEGDYQWWIRPWRPDTKHGEWSPPSDFEIVY